jgi:hypothetical protein
MRRGLVLVHELSEELAFESGGSRVRAIVGPDGVVRTRTANGSISRKSITTGRNHVQAQW